MHFALFHQKLHSLSDKIISLHTREVPLARAPWTVPTLPTLLLHPWCHAVIAAHCYC